MALFCLLSLLVQIPTLAPVSDETRDHRFSAYISKLKLALAKRDPKALKKLVDPDVISGGNGEKDQRGWEKFSQQWEVARPQAPLWDLLADLIELGFFRESPGIFVSPYLVWKFPKNLDPSQYLVVLRDPLPLRASPHRDAAAVATLHFDIVKRVDPNAALEVFDWLQVETASGKRGYVQASQVRSPQMPSAQFSIKNGQWRLSVLDQGH